MLKRFIAESYGAECDQQKTTAQHDRDGRPGDGHRLRRTGSRAGGARLGCRRRSSGHEGRARERTHRRVREPGARPRRAASQAELAPGVGRTGAGPERLSNTCRHDCEPPERPRCVGQRQGRVPRVHPRPLRGPRPGRSYPLLLVGPGLGHRGPSLGVERAVLVGDRSDRRVRLVRPVDRRARGADRGARARRRLLDLVPRGRPVHAAPRREPATSAALPTSRKV